MKTQLIIFNGQHVLVSDEKIQVGDFYYWEVDGKVHQIDNFPTDNFQYSDWKIKRHKVIAGGIPFGASIDFSYLSEEDCKTIGWIDVEALATKYATNHGMMCYVFPEKREGFIKGFTTAQSLSDKKYSEEQVRYLVSSVLEFTSHHEPEEFNDWFEKKLQKISQPKVFDVEVEMEEKQLYCDECKDILIYTDREWKCVRCNKRHTHRAQPKIVNKSIKVLKII